MLPIRKPSLWVALLLAVLAAGTANARTLTAQDAVVLALDHSLLLDAAEYGEAQAKAQADEALMQFFPKITGTAGYTRLDPVPYMEFDTSDFMTDMEPDFSDIDPDTLPPGWTIEFLEMFAEGMMGGTSDEPTEPTRIDMGMANNWQLAGQAEQIIFAGGALHQSRAASMDMWRASGEQVRFTRHDTAFQAEQSFYGLVAARNAVRVTADAQALTQAYVDDLQNLVDVGMASRADLLAAQVQLSQAKLDAMKMAHMTGLAERSFRIMLGIPMGERLELVMDDQLPVNDLPAERNAIVEMALRNRPDLASMDYTLDAMKHYSNAAWASWLPAVVLLGNLNAQNPNYSNEAEWMYSANATVALSWSLWDRGAAIHQNRAAKAGYRQLESQRAFMVEMMDVELESAITSFDEAAAELAVAREGLGQAQESMRLEQERFEAGVANNTQLLTAQTAMAGSELSVLQAETQMRISYAALRKAVGMEPEVGR